MSIVDNWDTGMVLTVILAPLCLAFVIIIFRQWQRINEIKHDLKVATTETIKVQQQLADEQKHHVKTLQAITEQKDSDIQRKQNEVVELHKKIVDLEQHIRDLESNDSGRFSGSQNYY